MAMLKGALEGLLMAVLAPFMMAFVLLGMILMSIYGLLFGEPERRRDKGIVGGFSELVQKSLVTAATHTPFLMRRAFLFQWPWKLRRARHVAPLGQTSGAPIKSSR